MTTETSEPTTRIIQPGDRGVYKDNGEYTGYEKYDGERIEIVREFKPKDVADQTPERLYEAYRRDRADDDTRYTLMVFEGEFIPNVR